jgi:hypothetical protein
LPNVHKNQHKQPIAHQLRIVALTRSLHMHLLIDCLV